MVRLFNVYYPVRALVLVIVEGLIVCSSFLVAAFLRLGNDSSLVLNYEYGFLKILAITTLTMVCMHYFDLYDRKRVTSKQETTFRILLVLGILCFVLAGITYTFPQFQIGNQTLVLGVAILTCTLFGWRSAYGWLVKQPFLRERIIVLGEGKRANWLVNTMRAQPELGMEVIGWAGSADDTSGAREVIGNRLMEQVRTH